MPSQLHCGGRNEISHASLAVDAHDDDEILVYDM
jgi:hypothetical protein